MTLQRQLRELNIRPKKRLGQHFVVEVQVLRRIVDCADLRPDDVILEIGAGLGNLTAHLVPRVSKVYAVEIDPRLAGELRKRFSSNPEVEIIQGDALKVNFISWFPKGKKKVKVVANLPYEISSPMIFRLLAERELFSLLVLMLQKEVARRLVARPATKDYGPLSLWAALYSQPSIVFPVKPQAFYPQPKVDSAVVKLEILAKPALEVQDEKNLQSLIRSAFTYRRKKLVNALRLGGFSHLSVEKIKEALEAIGVSPQSRGEALTLEQFCRLGGRLSAL